MKYAHDITSSPLQASDVVRWHEHLRLLHQRLRPYFARPEPFERALRFVQAMLSEVPRKNRWQLAEQAREATPYGMRACSLRRCGTRTACAMTCADWSWRPWGNSTPSSPLMRPAFPNWVSNQPGSLANTVALRAGWKTARWASFSRGSPHGDTA